MLCQLFGVSPANQSYQIVNIFGHTSKGIPGLDIKGLGSHGIVLKEKMIYLTKAKKINIPLYHYRICVESSEGHKKMTWDELKWLELPILLLYWSLAKVVPLAYSKPCYCAGYFLTSGKILTMPLSKSLLDFLALSEEDYVWIGNKTHQQFKGRVIPVDSLLQAKSRRTLGNDYIDKILASSV